MTNALHDARAALADTPCTTRLHDALAALVAEIDGAAVATVALHTMAHEVEWVLSTDGVTGTLAEVDGLVGQRVALLPVGEG